MQYYVARNGQAYGPYTVAEMRDYLANGRVTYADQIRSADSNEWLSVSTVPELAGVLPPLPAPMVAPPPAVPDGKQFRRKVVVLRDIVIVYLLKVLGSLIAGFWEGFFGVLVENSELEIPVISQLGLVFGTIGFVISGYLTPKNRWSHLVWVMLGAWLLSLIEIPMGVPYIQWASDVVCFLAMMLIGGGISLIFKRSQ